MATGVLGKVTREAEGETRCAGSPETSSGSDDIRRFFSLGAQIGNGHSGVVRKCVDLRTGESLACKSIPKAKLKTEAKLAELEAEIVAMQRVKGASQVVELKGLYEDNEAVHLVMDLCPEGDLYEYLAKKKYLSEKEAARVTWQVAKALVDCHRHAVIHRDIKPENVLILCMSTAFDGSKHPKVKIADFGLAVNLRPGQAKAGGVAGSCLYMAPELVKGREYDEKIDIWSLGVTLYTALTGFLPFWGSTNNDIFAQICKGSPDFKQTPWPQISPVAKELVQQMLSLDPAKRPTAAEVLSSSWLAQYSSPRGSPRSSKVRAEATGLSMLNHSDFRMTYPPPSSSNSHSHILPESPSTPPPQSPPSLVARPSDVARPLTFPGPQHSSSSAKTADRTATCNSSHQQTSSDLLHINFQPPPAASPALNHLFARLPPIQVHAPQNHSSPETLRQPRRPLSCSPLSRQQQPPERATNVNLAPRPRPPPSPKSPTSSPTRYAKAGLIPPLFMLGPPVSPPTSTGILPLSRARSLDPPLRRMGSLEPPLARAGSLDPKAIPEDDVVFSTEPTEPGSDVMVAARLYFGSPHRRTSSSFTGSMSPTTATTFFEGMHSPDTPLDGPDFFEANPNCKPAGLQVIPTAVPLSRKGRSLGKGFKF